MQLCFRLFIVLIRYDRPFPRIGVRLCVQYLTHDALAIRKVCVQYLTHDALAIRKVCELFCVKYLTHIALAIHNFVNCFFFFSFNML